MDTTATEQGGQIPLKVHDATFLQAYVKICVCKLKLKIKKAFLCSKVEFNLIYMQMPHDADLMCIHKCMEHIFKMPLSPHFFKMPLFIKIQNKHANY